MSNFTKYTLRDSSDSPALQAVTDVTEELFCGPAVLPIFVAAIQDGGLWADVFDERLYDFVSQLPFCLQISKVEPLNAWQAMQDLDLTKGIATAVSTYVRSIIAYKAALAANTQGEDLMFFEEEHGAESAKGGVSTMPTNHASAKQSAPKFALDPRTAQALVNCKAYRGIGKEHYNGVIREVHYYVFVSEILSAVLNTYKDRLAVAIGPSVYNPQKGEYLSKDRLAHWIKQLASAPPHLVTFTPYDPKKHSGLWSRLTSQVRPGHCRVQWACDPPMAPCDIPMAVVQATKHAIATAPKVPYLACQCATKSLPLYAHWTLSQRRQ
jgi:hypothetical protein